MDEIRAFKKILLITSSAGHGHMVAASALEHILKEKFQVNVDQHDILTHFLSPLFGNAEAKVWKWGQQKGKWRWLKFLTRLLSISEYLIWVPIFINALRYLHKNKVDMIIDTQIQGTTAFLQAIACIEWWYGYTIRYQKLITELPTDYTSDFFKPLVRLKGSLRNKLRLWTLPPLLRQGESEEDFWKRNCSISLDKIDYFPFPLRYSFQKASEMKNPLPELIFDLKDPIRSGLLNKTLSASDRTYMIRDNQLIYPLYHTNEKIMLILLGGNPNQIRMAEYLQTIIDLFNEKKIDSQLRLTIILPGSPKDHGELQQKIDHLVEKQQAYPSSLAILPIPFQSDEIIAPLMKQADVILCKSGGLTSIELLHTATGQIWIDRLQESGSYPAFWEKFFYGDTEGMIEWEFGNALYLKIKKGASFMTPMILKENYHTLLSCEKPLFSSSQPLSLKSLETAIAQQSST